jgi:hypothetical protein
VGGNASRWINHACEPNCEADEEEGRVFIKALRKLKPGEELFYDYGLVIDERYTPKLKKEYECRCGSPSAAAPCWRPSASPWPVPAPCPIPTNTCTGAPKRCGSAWSRCCRASVSRCRPGWNPPIRRLLERARAMSGQPDAPVTRPGDLDSLARDERTPHGRRTGDISPCLLVASSRPAAAAAWGGAGSAVPAHR